MIPRPISDIELPDLQALIDEGVSEGKTIEYKRELPGGADSEKVPFLAAVSSFANTSGGDLLIGVEAVEGAPKGLLGVDVANLDQLKLRLDHMISNGLQPRLPRVDIHAAPVDEDRHVLVVRAPKSWVSPHRVRQNSKFYGRNSAGRYELDVGELRTAFTLSETASERIRNFRTDRIAKIYGDETPVPLEQGVRMIMHLLPLSVFTGRFVFDTASLLAHWEKMRLIGSSGQDNRINLDGVLIWSSRQSGNAFSYTQIFRSGAVEAVHVFPTHQDVGAQIPSVAYEQSLIEALSAYLPALKQLGIEPPVYAFLSFIGVRGCGFPVHRLRLLRDEPPPLREDALVLPEVVVEDLNSEAHRVMRPLFDMVWNAFGLLQSENYDTQGNWVGR